ncbi:D-3-phosphoglycerate dehydrogenase [hydrothermal vent metagenome]|uniref:D-3-phosphoglycerate dehydrogenase n=1 Tax=hydrothermal vent metagenome TaxID=652676 RepID=A0A3B0R9W1_9ZZZZ
MSAIIPFVAQLDDDETRLWQSVLRDALPGYQVVAFEQLDEAQRAGVEVAIVADPDPGDLALLPNLKWVQSLWAGVERLMTELPNAGFDIVRLTDPQLAADMSEAALAWTLYLHRDMPAYRVQQERKIWQHHELPLPSQRCVGVLGLGKLGTAAAGRLLANGFEVCGWSRSKAEIARVTTYAGPDGLSQILKRSDILIVLVPLTDQTHSLLNEETLALLPNGASIINFARGPVINDQALLAALDSGHLKHAVLDVFDIEPLPQDSPLWQHPKVTVLPHISARTNYHTASVLAAGNITRFFKNGEMPTVVDKTLGY